MSPSLQRASRESFRNPRGSSIAARSIGQHDCGDLQVEGANSQSQILEPPEFNCSALIESEDWNPAVVVEVLLQSSVSLDLVHHCACPRQKRKPAPHLLFKVDNCGDSLARRKPGKAGSQFLCSDAGSPFEEAKVIGVEHHHGDVSAGSVVWGATTAGTCVPGSSPDHTLGHWRMTRRFAPTKASCSFWLSSAHSSAGPPPLPEQRPSFQA